MAQSDPTWRSGCPLSLRAALSYKVVDIYNQNPSNSVMCALIGWIKKLYPGGLCSAERMSPLCDVRVGRLFYVTNSEEFSNPCRCAGLGLNRLSTLICLLIFSILCKCCVLKVRIRVLCALGLSPKMFTGALRLPLKDRIATVICGDVLLPEIT